MKNSRAKRIAPHASTQPRHHRPDLAQDPPQSREPWEADYRCRFKRWDRFETELHELLHTMLQEPRRFLIISRVDGSRYIQFAAEKDGAILAEAVGNNFLKNRERLSQATCRKLVELGWKNPSKKSPNFWKYVRPPIPPGDFASSESERSGLYSGFPRRWDCISGVANSNRNRTPNLSRSSSGLPTSMNSLSGTRWACQASTVTAARRAISVYIPSKIPPPEERIAALC